MGSRRVAVAGQVMLLACGAVAALAWNEGLFGASVLAVLVGAWLVALNVLRASPGRRLIEPPASPHPREVERTTLRVLVDQVPTPLVSVEPDGRARALNRAARLLFKTGELVSDLPELRASTTVMHSGRRYRVESALVGGRRTIFTLSDIEGTVRVAEARAVRELLDVLSHEVMNAVAPIASLADSALGMLRSPNPDQEELQDAIGTVTRRIGSLQRFTEAYRELARLPEPRISAERIGGLIDDLARLFASRWRGRAMLWVETSHSDLAVPMDRDQIGQALWALLQNAAEAGHLRPTGPANVRITSIMEEKNLLIRVADDGPGVPADRSDDIFQLFFTTKGDGTGIGLSLARQIARAHGGDIVTVPCGTGATFQLSIPIAS